MSEHQQYLEQHREDHMPRFEPWLGVAGASIIPIIVALFVDRAFVMTAIVAAVVLVLVALAMLGRDALRRREGRQARRGVES